MIKLASFPLIEKLYDLEVNDTNINLFRGSVVDVVKNAKQDDLTAMEAFILGAFFTMPPEEGARSSAAQESGLTPRT